MAKKNYEQLALQIIDLVGGKSNIVNIMHCVTRLRFNVKDKGLVESDKIEKLDGVIGIQWQGDQFQIIIGQSVADVYQLICQKAGLSQQESINENLDAHKKKFSINLIFEAIAGCVTPIIPVLIGGGFIKIIVLICEMLGILQSKDPTFIVLTFVGDAAFYFLPVFVGATAARKFGANMGLGMLMGAIFIHPSFIAAVSAGTALSVFKIPIYATSYTSSILPTLLTVWIMAYVEKFFAKHSPEAVRSMIEPLFTLLIMVPLALGVLGPIGSFLGTYLSQAIIWIYNTTGFFGIAVLTSILPWLVMTGMHSALMPYAINSFATLGYEPIVITANVISNINQGAASAAVAFKSKDVKLKSMAGSSATTAIVGGISEPAMYGVNLKLKTPMYGAMIGSFVGGAVAGIGKIYAYSSPGGLGIFAFPIYINKNMANLYWWIAAVLIGFVVTFIATYILYKEEKEEIIL